MKDYFNNEFGKANQPWANKFNAYVQRKVDVKGNSSNGTTSLYGTDTKSKICIEQLSHNSSTVSDDDILRDSEKKNYDSDQIKEVDSHYEATTTNSPTL